MLLPPLTLQDLSLLLAVGAILLLATAELVPYIFGEKTLISDMKKLRNLAIIIGFLFFVTVAVEFLAQSLALSFCEILGKTISTYLNNLFR
jgi:hypothetical protein